MLDRLCRRPDHGRLRVGLGVAVAGALVVALAIAVAVTVLGLHYLKVTGFKPEH